MKVTFGPFGFSPIPDGLYKAVLDEILKTKGKYGDCFEFRFRVLDGKYKGKPIGKRIKIGRVGDQLWQVAKALMGIEYDEITELDIAVLKGKVCMIQIENVFDPQIKRSRCRICDFFPLEVNDGHQISSDESGRLGN